MVIDRFLKGNYLQERKKTRLLIVSAPFLLVVLLTLPINLLLGMTHLSGYLNLFVSIVSMGVVSLLLMLPLIAMREYELAAAFCVVVEVYVDWYLGTRYIALGLILVLLLVYYRNRSPQRIWVFPRMQGLWLLLLLLAVFPALRGYTLSEGPTYYLTILLAAFLAFWLGNVLAQNTERVYRFFSILSALSTALALITLIQALTGKLLFYSPRYEQFYKLDGYFELSTGSSIYRIGGLLVNPDWNGAFLAIVVFIPLSLFFVSSTQRAKALYIVEVLLILLALLTTYTTGAWLAVIVAFFVFLTLLGNMRSRLILLGLLGLGSAAVLIFFHTQLVHQLQHSTTVSDSMIRVVAWQTGLRVIKAFPLTGVGLGQHTYLHRMLPYHVPGKYYRALGTPQDSFLEVTAMGGLPLGIVFLALLSLAVWWACRNWVRAENKTRTLLAGGIASAIALTVNSIGNQGWTVAVLAATAWLILGVVSSPLFTGKLINADEPTQILKSVGSEEEKEGRSYSIFPK